MTATSPIAPPELPRADFQDRIPAKVHRHVVGHEYIIERLLIRMLKRNAATMLTLGLLHRPPKPRPATIWTEASEPPVADEIRNWRDEEQVPLTLSR